MNKRMREIQTEIQRLTKEAQGFMVEGEGRDLDKAATFMDQVDELQKEFDLLERTDKAAKAAAGSNPAVVTGGGKPDGFKIMTKMLGRKALDDTEKAALVSGTDAANGENYLVPEDVRAEINELRKSYVSAKNLVTVITTESLSGSVNYESGAPAGLTAFDDGDAISEDGTPTFVKKPFTISFKGKLIPVSRILLGAEKGGLLSYLNRWFVKNAIISENKDIFTTLKDGYNGGTPKAVAGWKELKKSITVDLDPSCLHDGVIITNQSGFAALDAEEDNDGRSVLQSNPAYPTQKLFQGLVIHVFPDAQLANIDATHFPVIYGSTKAGCTFMEHKALQFATSEHYGFNKNQDYLRVIEGFDTMSTDTEAYVYGSFAATTA